MTETRLYAISDGSITRLIEAKNAAQAIAHCARRFKCTVPNTKEVAALVAGGAAVELAGQALPPELDASTDVRR